MRRKYYTDYAIHAMKMYTRALGTGEDHDLLTPAECMNWDAAVKTMGKFSDQERSVLLQLYEADGPFEERVSTVSQRFGFSELTVRHLSDRALKIFAMMRGLV